MKKHLKNSEIIAIMRRFSELERREQRGTEALKLSAAVAWKRRLNRKALAEIAGEIEKAMEEIRKVYRDNEHSETDPKNAGIRSVKAQYLEEFRQREKDVMDQETDVEIRMVKVADLPDGLTDLQMDTLDFMLEE